MVVNLMMRLDLTDSLRVQLT